MRVIWNDFDNSVRHRLSRLADLLEFSLSRSDFARLRRGINRVEPRGREVFTQSGGIAATRKWKLAGYRR